jgi:hypothetical protein
MERFGSLSQRALPVSFAVSTLVASKRNHSAMRASPFFALALLSPAFAADDEGFTPIFNGKDLSGWVNVNCAPETWGVKDGMLTCTGAPIGALRTEKQYENFILECEWRHLKSGGNAGVFVWASAISWPGVPFLRAIEVQVLDNGYGQSESHTTHGDVFPIHGSTMEPFGRHKGMRSFPSEERSKGSPEWNHYRIEAKDGVIRLSVNGKEVSGGEKCNWRKGYLALESEGAPVEWRNLRVKELPSSGAKPDESAPEAQGHRALYNGVDLRGWTTDSPERWKVNDWQLVQTEGPIPEPESAALNTTEKFGDCEILLDCRIPKDAPRDASAVVRLRGASISIPAKRGDWTRATITVKNGTANFSAGSASGTVDLSKGPAKGPIGISCSGGSAIEFASIYVREL